MKFMILANPRSRTKWLSEYLSRDGFRCGHDILLGCRDVDEYLERLRNLDGTVETSAAMGYKIWKQQFPEAKFVIINRMPFEVGESFAALGFEPDWMFIYIQDLMLWKACEDIERSVLFSFESLARVETRRDLCGYLDFIFDSDWDSIMEEKKIEIDAQARFKLLSEFPLQNLYSDMMRRVIQIELEENDEEYR